MTSSQDPNADHRISVVVVNWNSREELSDCLRALDSQIDRDFETIVVDNGSTDGSSERVRDLFPWVRLLETGENLGFAEGCNRGIEVATGTWIATLNNDACADRDWTAVLRAAARSSGPRLGMLQSKIVFKHDPARLNSTGVLLYDNGKSEDRDFGRPVADERASSQVFCPTAGAAMYRREMLDELRLSSGFFDRTFFMYFEDVDLGWRARLAGWDALYVPEAAVRHAFQASSRRHVDDFVGWHCRKNRLRALIKNASTGFILRSTLLTVWHGLWVLRAKNWLGLREFISAASEALALRREVERLIRVPRTDVERRWATPAGSVKPS